VRLPSQTEYAMNSAVARKTFRELACVWRPFESAHLCRQSRPGAHGFGLPTMCERASRLGGRTDIDSRQGIGTEIRMSVPLSGKAQRKGTTNEWKFNSDGR
jgi:hypothetical protein